MINRVAKAPGLRPDDEWTDGLFEGGSAFKVDAGLDGFDGDVCFSLPCRRQRTDNCREACGWAFLGAGTGSRQPPTLDSRWRECGSHTLPRASLAPRRSPLRQRTRAARKATALPSPP